ncbi:MAG: cell division protein FtsQ/DivIB [Alphaproteobacteria bacterium]|nr:cell division protein FtsQ/DivIB [Alphaproteobacteria bacterium]
MKHKLFFWLNFGLAVMLAIYGAVRISMVLMGGAGQLSAVRKASVSVINGSGDAGGIAQRLNIAPGLRAAQFDLDEALERVVADPDIALAGVRRTANGEIIVRAQMRVIVAAWTDGEKYYPLDANGSPINRPLDARPDNMLVFSGTVPGDISNISAALKRAPGLLSRAARIEFVEGRRWDIFLHSGARVMLPEGDPEGAILKLEKTHRQNAILDRKIKILDMRDVARPLVKL